MLLKGRKFLPHQKNFLMKNISLIYILFVAMTFVSAPVLSGQQNYGEFEEQLAFDAVKALAYYASHPEEITTKSLKKSFPGDYERIELTCHGAVGYCGHGNVDATKDPQLQSYYVAAGDENRRIGGTLALSFGKSKYCFEQKNLDTIFKKTGEEPSYPPTIGFGDMTTSSKIYRYNHINSAHPGIYALALVSGGCVVNVNLEARLLN